MPVDTEPVRRLVINCDDFGSVLCANEAVAAALDTGLARSATVMVPCPWAYDAVRRAVAHPEWAVGVHLTLTSEWPRYRWRPLSGRAQAPSLCDGDGFMWRTQEDLWRHADAGEALRECMLQVERALAWGLRPTHLDTHMGALEADGPWIAAYAEIARRFDLPVRLIQEARFAQALRGVRHPARFAFRPRRERPDQPLLEVMRGFVRDLPQGTTETCLHPCLESGELHAAMGPEQAFRVDEARVITGDGAEALAGALAAAGIVPASYRDLA